MKKENLAFVVFMVAMIGICALIFVVFGNDSSVYAAQKGYGYEYVTEVMTEITSVDVSTNTVFVSYKGNEYGYRANGKINTNGKVTVVFNEKMEIVDVK